MASTIRKEKYKKILEKGGEIAEEIESRSVVENLQIIQELVRDTDSVHDEGKVSDRVGQSSELVLDSQVIQLDAEFIYYAFEMRQTMTLKFIWFFSLI